MKDYLFDVVVVFSLILCNGLLAMAELAIVSSSRSKMHSLAKKNGGAKIALELMDNPGAFLSTIQTGITIIGIVSGVFSGQRLAEPMGLWLNSFEWVYGYGNAIAFTLVVILITYLSIVFGELIPKRLGIAKPELMAAFLARPVLALSKATHPFVSVLDISTRTILRLFNQKEIRESTVTEEEIHSVIKQGLEEGAIDDFEHKVFQKVLQFGDREVGLIMTPRIKVAYLDMADSMDENTKKILENPHRYYPIFDGGLDNFKGIIDSKDALKQMIQSHVLDFNSLIKEAPCVIEDNLGPDLLEQFKKYRTHIAVVVDEYGTMQGIVTLVDVFETLVGTVPQSDQSQHYAIRKRQDGSWLCDGLTPIDDVEDLLGLEIVETFQDNDFNTLAGFLLIHFKHIPHEGEYMHWNGFKFEIADMDGSRIDKVLIQHEDKLAP